MPLKPADAQALLQRLTSQHGELIGGMTLAHCLGYRTPRAFQIALQRRQVPVTTFPIAGRRGRFARTSELAHWLAHCDTQSEPTDVT